MRKTLLSLVILCLCGTLVTAHAENAPAAQSSSKELPGRQIAETISLITGVAISPLLGVGAVGAYQYFHAKTPEQKAKLPWFANPMFWAPALLIVTACFIKDTAGTALPSALKKPFDVAETIEHKISGLVATGAFVPIAASIFSMHNGGDGAMLSSMGFATIDLSWLYNAIMVPIAMVAFFIVFLASNAINILILLSPFTTVDAALKAFRGAILASVVASAWANPWVGAAWALIIILISWLIAGWSFRLSHLGTVFIWDFVTGRSNRFQPDKVVNRMFLGRKINKVPARTYGLFARNSQGKLVFHYRPWLVLPVRILELPESKYAVGKGAFFSEILQLDGETARTIFLLPPRYRSHEAELAAIYGFTDVRDVGLRAAWQWFKGLLGFRARVPAAAG